MNHPSYASQYALIACDIKVAKEHFTQTQNQDMAVGRRMYHAVNALLQLQEIRDRARENSWTGIQDMACSAIRWLEQVLWETK